MSDTYLKVSQTHEGSTEGEAYQKAQEGLRTARGLYDHISKESVVVVDGPGEDGEDDRYVARVYVEGFGA